MMRDQDFGVVRIRAFGTYDFRVSDPKLFLREVAGSDEHFRLDEFADTMRSRIVSVFTEALAQAKIPALDVAARYSEVGNALLPVINPIVCSKYGLEISSFILENVSVPPEVEQAIDKRSSMAAVGNLNDYVKYQMAQGLNQPGGGAGVAGAAAQLGVGLQMGQQMMQQTANTMAGATAPPAAAGSSMAATPGSLPDVLSPADAAKALGVSEADVVATLESGDLKGKKIGASWRITRDALNAYLKS